LNEEVEKEIVDRMTEAMEYYSKRGAITLEVLPDESFIVFFFCLLLSSFLAVMSSELLVICEQLEATFRLARFFLAIGRKDNASDLLMSAFNAAGGLSKQQKAHFLIPTATSSFE
jgi:hypothetical protein